VTALQPHRARLLPALVIALAALAILRAAGLAFAWSDASAAKAAPLPVTSPSRAAAPNPIVARVADRDAELAMREAELKTRETVIAAAEARLEARLKALDAREADLAARAQTAEQARSAEIEALSDAYEKMRAKDAARIFEALDDEILVPVAAGMRVQSLAGVLAEMSPQRARFLTNALAGRPVTEETP
jgi:flagellar motility protein MotE (MotC chaperone)